MFNIFHRKTTIEEYLAYRQFCFQKSNLGGSLFAGTPDILQIVVSLQNIQLNLTHPFIKVCHSRKFSLAGNIYKVAK